MSHTVKTEKNKVTFTITIPAEQVKEAMKEAATRIGENTEIAGFRPGKADYATIEKRVGEMKILEEATEGLVRTAFMKALLEEKIDSVGQPYFNMNKMAPGNDMEFTAEVSLMPSIQKLADYSKLSIKKQDSAPKQELIDQAKKDLVGMQTKEVRAKSGTELKQGDKVVVNLTMKKDGVVVEGGEGQDHGIYTSESYYVDGFIDQILGSKEGDVKTFTLTFPKDHYQKHMAGAEIEFTVEVKEIFNLDTPKFDDAFAKNLGMKDVKDLEGKLIENLTKENQVEEDRRQEKEMLELLSGKSNFDDIPDLLVNQEVDKMINEMKQAVAQRGVEFEEYLTSIGKTFADMKLDFATNALTRVKVALLLKEIAKLEDVKVEAKELDAEIVKVAEKYEKEDQKKYIQSPQYRDYVEMQMKNKKTLDILRDKMVK
ncbi:trigger factor [Candidatus Uhrbacteria bacterium]|jgi:trigger factor|nr:trigger factor [Candidatus Uhrbacteria bacterium]MBT7717176.1 trigger factor [Candidatus Uhrbacteria bacterium]